jgi:hypothetical protein
MLEPHITINGVTLSDAQAMTVRVALESFVSSLADPDGLGDDDHGHAMTSSYLARVVEIRRAMYGKRALGPGADLFAHFRPQTLARAVEHLVQREDFGDR